MTSNTSLETFLDNLNQYNIKHLNNTNQLDKLLSVTETMLSFKTKLKNGERSVISDWEDADKIFRDNWNPNKELLEDNIVLFLKRNNGVEGALQNFQRA